MRREGYREQILNKQIHIIPHAKAVDLTIIGGDIFHQKKSHKVSHYLVNRIMEIYREYGNLFIVPGNHDFDMNPEELKYNPLGTVAKLPNVRLLHGGIARSIMGMDIFFKGLGDFKEDKTLIDMLKEWQIDQTERAKSMTSILYNIAVIHDSVSYRKFPFETISLSSIAKYADLFLLGHIHKPQGETAKMVSPGALSRGSLEKDTVDRAVCFVVISIDTDERRHDVKPIRLGVKPAEEVFKIEQKLAEVRIDDKVNKFLEYLQTVHVDLKVTDAHDMIQKIEALDMDERVKKEAIKILEQL